MQPIPMQSYMLSAVCLGGAFVMCMCVCLPQGSFLAARGISVPVVVCRWGQVLQADMLNGYNPV